MATTAYANSWKRIVCHEYRTPPHEVQGEELYSIGILNVTREEGRLLVQLAEELQRQRNIAAKDRPDRITVPLQRPLGMFDAETNTFNTGVVPKPKPALTKAEPPNRFSGLDFGDDK